MLRAAGAAVAISLPPLEAMIDGRGLFYGEARAQTSTAPKKLFVLHWPQGLPVGWGAADGGFWYPTSGGAITVTEGLKPLEPHALDINLVNGLTYEQITEHVGSHGHAVAVFTGYKAVPEVPDSPNPLASGASVEQVAGGKIGTATKFASISAGLYEEDEVSFAWSGPGQRVPLKNDPVVLFDDLFGSLGGDDGAAQHYLLRKQSVIDTVKHDIERLNGVLGAADRAKLDEHLTAIRAIETRLTAPASATCTKPIAPAPATYGDEQSGEYSDLMMDLLVMALRCDITHVVFLSLGKSQNYRTWPQLGVTTDYHNIAHGTIRETPEGAAQADAWYKLIAIWHMERIAYALDLLKQDDNGTTLLDDMAFVATSEFSTGSLHHNQFMPAIVAGKINGMATGQNIICPCDMPESWQEPSWCGGLPGSPNRCMNDLWTSALRAVGALGESEIFGDPSLPTASIPGLWA